MTEFYDSAKWPAYPPDPDYAALYADGDYARFQDPGRWQHVRWITVHGHYRSCGIIDFEPGNWAFNSWTLRRFVLGRKALGLRARVYCDRADAREALDVLGSVGLSAYPEWWIATLDGYQWTAAELAADLAANWHAPIPVNKLWAVQWAQGAGGAYDQSTLFGQW